MEYQGVSTSTTASASAGPSSLGSLPPQQQALSAHPQLVSFSVCLDVNVLQDRINHLEAALKLAQKENQFLKEEKEAATQRHLDELRKREERHQLKIQKLKGKISQLKRELQGQTDRVSALEEDVKTLKEQARRSTDAAKHARYRLLVGTLAFMYVESAIEFVLRPRSYKERKALMSRLHGVEDVEAKAEKQGAECKQRMESFKSTYWAEDYDPVLLTFARDRRDIAHPITVSDEDDEPPSPQTMKEIVSDVYKQRSNRHLCSVGMEIIDALDQLHRSLDKFGLFGDD